MKEIEDLIRELFSCQTSTKEMAEWKEEITQYVTDSIGLLQHSGLSESEACYIAKQRLMDSDVVNEFQTYQQKMMIEHKETSSLSNLVLVGCSTGGPKALHEILAQLPIDLPAAFVIAQHMPEGNHTKNLAAFLNSQSAFDVKEAEDGEEIVDGKVYISPGGFYTKVFKREAKYYISLNKQNNRSIHGPSLDVLFSSVAKLPMSIPIYAGVLTGMGTDGLLGLQTLKTHHPHTVVFAEHENSAVIYGMPKHIVTHELADFVVDISMMVRMLCSSIQSIQFNGFSSSILIASNQFFYRALIRAYLEKRYPGIIIQSADTHEKMLLLEKENTFNLVITNYTELKDVFTPILYVPCKNSVNQEMIKIKLNLLSV